MGDDGYDPTKNEEDKRRSTEDSTQYGVSLLMDDLLDKLKLLRYQTEFCGKKGFRPMHKYYFAVLSNANEQLHYFGSLVSWLLSLVGHKYPAPDQYDDPNSVATSIMIELKKLGLPLDFSPTKLKQGFGEEVCHILLNLTQNALKAKKFRWNTALYESEDFAEEEEEEQGVELVAEAVIVEDDVDEIDEMITDTVHTEDPSFFKQVGKGKDEPKPLDETPVDTAAWNLEVERVLPLLKVHITADNKDWRHHLEEMEQHQQAISSALSETKGFVTHLQEDIGRAMEKISSREKYLNSQLENLVHEFRLQQDALAASTQRYKQSSTRVSELSRELAAITDELEVVKAQMDERGSSMTDSGPVVRIKQAINKIKTENTQMDLRIGVLQHTLLSLQLKQKNAMVRDMQATGADQSEPEEENYY